MPSPPSSTVVVVLHTGAEVTLTAYLFRVLVYLLAFAGVGVTVFWSLRVIDIVRSKASGRGGSTESEP